MPLDTIRSLGARMLLNKYFEGIGEVSEVDIDAKMDCASLLVLLKGETDRIRLEVSYRVEPQAFVLEHFRCERVWVENTLNRFVAGLRIDIEHSGVQALLKHLL